MPQSPESAALSEGRVTTGDHGAELWRHVLKEIDRFLTRVLRGALLIGNAETIRGAGRAALSVDSLRADGGRGKRYCGKRNQQTIQHRLVPQVSITEPEPGRSDPTRQPLTPACSVADNTDLTSVGAQMTTIPTPMLKVRYISDRSTFPAPIRTPNTSGTLQLPVSITASSVDGSARSRFSSNPPPVMCAIA